LVQIGYPIFQQAQIKEEIVVPGSIGLGDPLLPGIFIGNNVKTSMQVVFR